MNETLSYQTQLSYEDETQLSYEEFLEYWDSTLENNTALFISKLLTDEKFATIVLDEIFQWLICYCHLWNKSTIKYFARALCVKLSLDLDFADADADAGKIWHRALSTLDLDAEHRKLLRLVPDDAQKPLDAEHQKLLRLVPDDAQKEGKNQKEKSPQQHYLEAIIKAAKDAAKDREIYAALFDALFSDTEKSISNYQTAASELRYALIIDVLITDTLLTEDL